MLVRVNAHLHNLILNWRRSRGGFGCCAVRSEPMDIESDGFMCAFSLTRGSPTFRRSFAVVLMALAFWLNPSAASSQRYYTVKQGQTLSSIAHRYRISIWDLALSNKTHPKKMLRAGQTLIVPPRGVTYVRPGQTLSQIARSHNCTVRELKRLNRIRNETLIRVGSRLILPGYAPETQKNRDWGKPEQPGVVILRNHDKRMTVRLVDSQRRVLQQGIVELREVMHHLEDDSTALPNPRLVLLLAILSDHFGGREITVVSGFREAIGYTNETSQHVAGRAIDLRVEGVPHRLVWEFCRSLKMTGCGYYPRSVFVHVDVRERDSQWVDWSRPGKRPRYGTLRRPYRWRERRNPERPRVTRKITRPDLLPLSVSIVDKEGQIIHKLSHLQEANAVDEAAMSDDS